MGKGGDGGLELADKVIAAVESGAADYKRIYDDAWSMEEKLEAIVTKVYGGIGVELSSKAQKQIVEFKKYGWDRYPICMAKTQYSLSDDPTLLGRPTDFVIHIREFIPKLGAGFVVALTGDVMTMPGLPKKPAALNMDVDENGNAQGLF
ncbi:Formate--tetrahydrofolate ligase [Listeria monocytogenes N53-1]|nr:Formate--tetrahydrofolate ligase [Listeria monocytogenes]CCQ24536.1 Formate--tetrahydrofolate ligase [Listeria monocytogenes N53-1]